MSDTYRGSRIDASEKTNKNEQNGVDRFVTARLDRLAMQDPQILNLKQTADRLGYHPKTIRLWLKRGICPVEPIPGMKPPKWRAGDVAAVLGAR